MVPVTKCKNLGVRIAGVDFAAYDCGQSLEGMDRLSCYACAIAGYVQKLLDRRLVTQATADKAFAVLRAAVRDPALRDPVSGYLAQSDSSDDDDSCDTALCRLLDLETAAWVRSVLRILGNAVLVECNVTDGIAKVRHSSESYRTEPHNYIMLLNHNRHWHLLQEEGVAFGAPLARAVYYALVDHEGVLLAQQVAQLTSASDPPPPPSQEEDVESDAEIARQLQMEADCELASQLAAAAEVPAY